MAFSPGSQGPQGPCSHRPQPAAAFAPSFAGGPLRQRQRCWPSAGTSRPQGALCPASAARQARPARNSLRSLRSLRSDSRAESVHEARWRARRTRLCCSARQTGRTAKQPAAGNRRDGLKSELFGCWLFGIRLLPRSKAPSSAVQGGARQRASSTDPGLLSDRSERSERREFNPAPPRNEQRREPLAQPGALEPGRAAFPHLAKTKWGRGAGAKRPAG
jgi:hypothetical protein